MGLRSFAFASPTGMITLKLDTDTHSAANDSRLNGECRSSPYNPAVTGRIFRGSQRFRTPEIFTLWFHALFTELPFCFSSFAHATSSLSDGRSYLELPEGHRRIRPPKPRQPSRGYVPGIRCFRRPDFHRLWSVLSRTSSPDIGQPLTGRPIHHISDTSSVPDSVCSEAVSIASTTAISFDFFSCPYLNALVRSVPLTRR